MIQKFKIVTFCYHIWIRCEKCIKTSTNMPSIGSVIDEKEFEILEILGKPKLFWTVK